MTVKTYELSLLRSEVLGNSFVMSSGQSSSFLMRLNIKLHFWRFTSSLNGSQSSRLKKSLLLSLIFASKITRAAFFCSLNTRFTFSSVAVVHAQDPYNIMGLIKALKTACALRGTNYILLSTAILCATFLQRSSICSVKFNGCLMLSQVGSMKWRAQSRWRYMQFWVFVLFLFSTILFSDVQSAILFRSSRSRCCTAGRSETAAEALKVVSSA